MKSGKKVRRKTWFESKLYPNRYWVMLPLYDDKPNDKFIFSNDNVDGCAKTPDGFYMVDEIDQYDIFTVKDYEIFR